MTTRQDLEMDDVARRMFARWSQENFFRYMRHEFALDHLPTSAVEPADPSRLVPNPAIKQKSKELQQLRAKLTTAERDYGEKALDNPEHKRPTMRGFKIAHAQLGEEIRHLRSACDALEAEVKALPKRVELRELLDDAKIVQLERERKVFTDAIKMAAYRAETQLANLVGPLLPDREDEARSFLQKVFQLPADIVPDEERRQLVVRLHGMANWRSNRALAALCEILNEQNVCFPGTDLQLVLEAPVSPE
jgi:hypothetical protein